MAVTARGLIGSGSATTVGTTITVTNTTGAVIPAGTFIHITGCWDNINSVTAPTITSSTVGGGTATANHATTIGSGVTTTAGSGVWHQCFRVLTTSTIASGGTIATLTSNQSAVKRAAHAEGFNNCTTTLRGTVTTATSGAGTPSVTSTGTALVVGDLVIGSISNENNAEATADADSAGGAWPPIVGIATSGGAANTNVNSGSQYKVLTATGTQTFNPTCPATDAVVCVYSVVPVPDPTFTQAAYRLYADGTETGATALAAEDTSYEADVSGGDVNLQLRVRVQSTNAGTQAATDDYQLQREKNASGTWADVVSTSAASVAASYSETNVSIQYEIGVLSSTVELGQSFLGDGRNLSQVEFWMRRPTAFTTGTLTARLYAHTGTFGSGTATGSPLATSTTSIAASTLGTTYAWRSFDFDPTYTLLNGTAYVIAVASTASDAVADACQMGVDNTSSTHAGCGSDWSLGDWTALTTIDCAFRLYTLTIGTTVVPYASANLTDSAATTNRLGAGTGSFSAGEVSEDGLVDDLTWTANNYTELLYSITLKQADVVDGDTLTFRVVRNGATTGFTYTAVPTIGITAAAVTTGTAAISLSAATTVTGTPTTFGTAALTESVAATVAGVPTTFGTALITITGNASATVGARIVTGTASITAAAAVTVAGTVTAEVVTGTALISSAATVTATATPTTYGIAVLTQSVTATVTGVPTTYGTAALTESAAIAAVGTPATFGTAAITVSAAITAAGTPTTPAGAGFGTAAINAAVTATATGTPTTFGTAALSESAAVTVVGTPKTFGTAAVNASASVTAVGTVTTVGGGAAVVNAPVTITAVGRRTTPGTAALTEQVAVTAAGAITATTVHGTALVSAAATTTVVGRRTIQGVAVLTGVGTVTVGTATRTVPGTALIATSLVVTALVVTYYDDPFPHTGSWALTYMATYALEYTATLNRDYRGGWDCTAPSATWDIDHSGTWELV